MKLPPWPPRARVLLYLSFDEGDGQVANSPGPWGDAVFGSSPETEPSDPQWTRGVRGGAVRFNGKDDYLTVPGVEQAQLAAFTFEAWVKPTGTSREMILDYGGTSWGFTFSKAWHGAYVVVGHKPKRSRIDTRQFAVSVDRWNHVAATFDGRDASVYVNGRLEARGDVPAPMGRGWPGWPLIIGKLRPNHYHMTGLLDELVVLDVARTEDEIFADIVSSMQPPAAPSSRQR